MENVYVFSGLGVDERVFKNIRFPNTKPIFIKWIAPFADETIEQYATRLLPQISHKKPVLIGLSFGGIMAIEVSKNIETAKIILIASAKVRNEIPFFFRTAGKLNIHKFIPASLLRSSNFLSNWVFGASAQDQLLLKEILKDTDPVFLKWAIDKLVHWKNQFYPKNLIHIHGTADRILPIKFVSADIIVEAGGHFMTVNKSAEINTILKKLL